MPYSEAQVSSNLAFFVEDCLAGRAHAFQRSTFGSIRFRRYASHSLLESYLWLHTGLRIGYFPVEGSRRIAYEYLSEILGAYSTMIEEPKIREDKFTTPVRAVLESELSGRAPLFGAPVTALSTSAEMSLGFQSLLLLMTSFEQEESLTQLAELLAFGTEIDWRSVMQDRKGYEEPDWSFDGFFAMIRYMEAYRETVSCLDGNDLATLKQFLREIQEWRFNFRDKAVYDRFLALGGLVRVTLATAQQISDRDLRLEIHELLTDWGAPALSESVGRR